MPIDRPPSRPFAHAKKDSVADRLQEIANIATICRNEMQGRLMDDEHRRAFRALWLIRELANG